MRPVPVAFHIWFLELHTYGIGLAITFWFGLRYAERRLKRAGLPWQWMTGVFVWILVAAIVGARAMHVISNWSYYSAHAGQIPSIWAGGLSSFGGLIAAIPVGLWRAKKTGPDLSLLQLLDLFAPVLMASWAIGRLLGPQLMTQGGGRRTDAWYGMYYANQPGKRLPVPIFQAVEDAAIFAVLILVERWLAGRARRRAEVAADATDATEAGADDVADAAPGMDGGPDTGAEADAAAEHPPGGGDAPARPLATPTGVVLGVGMVLWGIERFFDEYFWLGHGATGDVLVELAGLGLILGGAGLLASRARALVGPRDRDRGGDAAADVDTEDPAGTAEDGEGVAGEEQPDPVGERAVPAVD